MDWLKTYDKIVQFAKEKIWVIMFFWLSTGFVLFAPHTWLAVLKISNLPNLVASAFGLAFVFSSALLLVRGSRLAYEKHLDRLGKNRTSNLLKTLRKLHREIQDNHLTRSGCLRWSANVSPLLRFNDDIYEKFTSNANSLHSFMDPKKSEIFKRILNRMKHQVQRAIDEIEFDLNSNKPPNHQINAD